MARKRKVVDTSILIRYLSGDDPDKALAVERLLKSAKKGELELSDVAIAEMVWVLLSFYKLTKEEILDKLEGLLSLHSVKLNQALLKRTIDFYRRYNVSYVDAYLAAYSVEGMHSGVVYSYDEGLNKIKEISCIKP